MQRMRIALILFGVLLSSCTPALNWRSVPLNSAGLTVLLPCKPDYAVRPVELGTARPVELSMAGCDADGATFAVSHLRIDDPAQAGATLALWQAAVRARMHALAASEEPSLASVTPFVPAGALQLPQSVKAQMLGRAGDGSAVTAQAVWFARLEGAHARLYQAVVYSPAPRPEVAQTFIDGVRLQ